MNDDISRALDVLTNIDDPQRQETHDDEALQVLMSVASDTPAIHTGHPSTTVITPERSTADDPATATLEYIANERDDVSYLVGIANGESAHSLKYGRN
jgi:hypothetical protein